MNLLVIQAGFSGLENICKVKPNQVVKQITINNQSGLENICKGKPNQFGKQITIKNHAVF